MRESPIRDKRLSRRRVLAYSGGVVVAAGTGLFGRGRRVSAGSTQVAYFLDPEWGAGLANCPVPHSGGPRCHACKSCHSHSQKLFTSSTLAGSVRAHPNCRCLVRSMRVSNLEYVGYFGPFKGPFHRDQFDPRRDELFPQDLGN